MRSALPPELEEPLVAELTHPVVRLRRGQLVLAHQHLLPRPALRQRAPLQLKLSVTVPAYLVELLVRIRAHQQPEGL